MIFKKQPAILSDQTLSIKITAMDEIEQIEKAITALEAQRSILGNTVVETALGPLREKLSSLQRKPLGEQRKLVTVLFADLVGFTGLAEKMDPEDVREILEVYFSRATAIITEFGGVIEKFIGDAVMAVFGLSAAREDEPEQAIRAALKLRKVLGDLNEEWKPSLGLQLEMHAGIHTGPVVISLLGTRKDQEFVVIGDTVNLASRLESKAPAGKILISHETYRHVRGVFKVTSLDPVKIKGKKERVQVYQVHGIKPRSFHMPARGIEGVETHMVGRQAELACLQAFQRSSISTRELHFVTLVGEAGIGKTRLINEFENWLDLLPVVIRYFRARATPSMQGSPYTLLRDLFAFRFQIHDSDPAILVWEKIERGIAEAYEQPHEPGETKGPAVIKEASLARQSHYIGQLLGFDFNSSPYLPQLESDSGQFKVRAQAYLLSYFNALEQKRPLIILLEDLHWADDSSLDFLKRLSSEVKDQRLMIVASTRKLLYERRPEWGSESQVYSRIDLNPLSRNESLELVNEILQKVEQPYQALADLIIETAEGNPFYIEELIKMFIEDKVIEKGEPFWTIKTERLVGLRIPPSLTGLLQARLDALRPEERLVLKQASVIGRVFWDQAIHSLQRSTLRRGHPAPELQMILNNLRAREMLVQNNKASFENTQEFTFRHALLRDVIYASLLRRERCQYHAEAARWFEGVTQAGGRSQEYASIIAGHYELAEDPNLAATWHQRAGKHAAAHFQNQEAARCFTRSLELLSEKECQRCFEVVLAREKVYDLQGLRLAQAQDLAALFGLLDKMEREGLDCEQMKARVCLRKASFLEATGEYNEAIHFARKSIELAEKTGLPHNQAEGYLIWGRALMRQGEFNLSHEMLQRGLGLARQTENQSIEALCLRNLGIVFVDLNDYPAARECFEQALKLHRLTGDRRGESSALNNLGLILFNEGIYAESRRYYEQTLEIRREIGDRGGESIAFNNLGLISLNQGDYNCAREFFEKVLEICKEVGDRDGEDGAYINLGLVSMQLGEFEKAESYFEQALKICCQIGDRLGESLALADLGHLLCLRGEFETALERCLQSVEIAHMLGSINEQGYAYTYLGHALSGLNKYEEAEAAYRKAWDIRREIGHLPRSMEALAGLAHVHLRQHNLEQAGGCVREILSFLDGYPQGTANALESMDDPLRLLWVSWQILEEIQNQRAGEILVTACELLQQRAGKISQGALRLAYLENNQIHRELGKRCRWA